MSDSQFRVYIDPKAGTVLLGLRGTSTLEVLQTGDITLTRGRAIQRTINPCPSLDFYTRRVAWLIAHQNLREQAAQAQASREQGLRLLHVEQGLFACEYTYEDLCRVRDVLRGGDDPVLALLTEYCDAEAERRRMPRYIDVSTVFAPYIPRGTEIKEGTLVTTGINLMEMTLACEPYVPPPRDHEVPGE